MASICLSTSKTLVVSSSFAAYTPLSSSLPCSSSTSHRCFFLLSVPNLTSGSEIRSTRRWTRVNKQVVCMAPDEEKLTRRNPLDFPIEWERPKPGRRPDIFPQFSPMKTPLPPPLPYDPPEEDEEEEEKKEEEEEEDPEKEEDTPDKQ